MSVHEILGAYCSVMGADYDEAIALMGAVAAGKPAATSAVKKAAKVVTKAKAGSPAAKQKIAVTAKAAKAGIPVSQKAAAAVAVAATAKKVKAITKGKHVRREIAPGIHVGPESTGAFKHYYKGANA